MVREEAELTQVELATALERPQSFVSKMERGERRVDLVELQEICKICGVTLADFVNRFEPSRPRPIVRRRKRSVR